MRWTVIAPGRHVLYAFSKSHDSDAVDALLKDYKGYLVADAHAVYDHLFLDGSIVEVGCWAHARRYFFKALPSEPERARHALLLIQGLFRIEREISDSPPGKRRSTRRQQSQPIVDLFESWCDAEAARVLDETPLAKAFGYARNQRQALRRFLDDAQLPIHNNSSELALRREAIGRKNWLFLGADKHGGVKSGATNALFVSLLASCQLHRIEPLGYLRDLFCLLPRWPHKRVLELAPVCWEKTLQQEDTQKLLAANPFRRISLGHSPTV